jgi:hypothetical protein
MPRMRFELMIPVFERAKPVHALGFIYGGKMTHETSHRSSLFEICFYIIVGGYVYMPRKPRQ